MKITRQRRNRAAAGAVLVLSLLLLLALGSLTAALAVLQLRLHGEHYRSREDLRAFCVAEAGLNEAYAVLQGAGPEGVRAIPYPRQGASGSYPVALLDGRDDMEIDVDRVRLRSVGTAGTESAGVQLMIRHVPTGAYEFAAFGERGLLLNSNVTVDSFDSTDGPYPEKVEYVNDFGNVGSFEQIEIDSNVSVYGDALVGPDGVFVDDAPGIQVTGDQEACEIDEDMPVIAVPSFLSEGVLLIAGAKTIAAGNHHYDSLAISSGTLTVRGPATLVVDGFYMASGTKLVVDATDGPVQIYATGNLVVRSNTEITTSTGRARDLELAITSDNLTGGAIVDLRSNAEFTGTLYAPNARLKLPSNYTVFGAVKAAYVEMESNSAIHFDEDLLYDPDAPDVFELASWRRLSLQEIQAVEELPLP